MITIDEVPKSVKCPNKCKAGKWASIKVDETKGMWVAMTTCATCRSRNYWDFNPDRPMSQQTPFVRESYESFGGVSDAD